MAEEKSVVVGAPVGAVGGAGLPSGDGAAAPAAQPIRAGGKEYGSVDDLVRAYESANQELGRWTQQHGDLKKQYEETAARDQAWAQWWKGIQPYWGPDVENVIRHKMAGRGGQPAAPKAEEGHSTSGFEGFEYLAPAEQAARLQQAVSGQLGAQMQQQLGQIMQGLNQALQQKEQWYQSYLTNHLSLMRKALEKKLADPTFDVDKVMEGAAKAIAGQMDPIELGQQLLAAAEMESRLEAGKKGAYEQGKKDYEQELANKKLEAGPPASGAPPVFKPPAAPGTFRHGLTGLREKAAGDLVKKFGAGLFTGE